MRQAAAAPPIEWHRLSPRMLLVHPVIEVGRALPAILGAFLAGHSSNNGNNGSRWSLGIAGVVAAFAVLRWFTTSYRITAEQVQLRHGLLRRRTLATPMDRVRTVDVTAHLLHRVLGLARVVVGTGTSDRKGRNRLVLDGLSAGAASTLRTELLHRDVAAMPLEPAGASLIPSAVDAPATDGTLAMGGVLATDGGEQELAHADVRWLRYAPFTLTGAVTGLALLGVLSRVVSEGRVNLRSIGPYRDVADKLARWPLGWDLVLVLTAVLSFVVLASTVGYVLSFWHFRLSRHPGGTLHVSRGLLTSRATSIERRRLVGAELSEPLLLRAAGGARCLAIATGLRVGRGAERGGELLLPPAPLAEALRVSGAAVGSTAPFDAVLAPHPPAARRRRIVRAVAGAAGIGAAGGVLIGLAGWPIWLMYLTPLPVLVAVPLGLDRYRSLGHALVDGFVVTRSGSLVRRRCAIASAGVIGWNVRSSFFQRRQGLCTLMATTAAGRQKYRIADVGPAEALQYADTALPGLLTDFLA